MSEDQRKEIWFLIEKTLPEKNKERLTEVAKGVRPIPGIRVSSLKQWPLREITAAIVTMLKPSENAEQVRKDSSGWDELLSLEKVTAEINNELKNASRWISLISPSDILFYLEGVSEVYIEKLDANTFAYSMFYMDDEEERPLIDIEG